eukprot:1795396-Rhodomonas_salina.1
MQCASACDAITCTVSGYACPPTPLSPYPSPPALLLSAPTLTLHVAHTATPRAMPASAFSD